MINEGPGAVVKLLLETLETFPCLLLQGMAGGLILHMAAYAGDLSFTRLFLERGASVNAVGWYYGIALQAASRHGKLDVVEYLLRTGADENTLQG